MTYYKFLIECLIILFGTQLLLFPTNHSTDFEVHRNWMRITYNYPIKEWYFEKLSIWTLDYPPLFAYVQYLLACVSRLVDQNITDVRLFIFIFLQIKILNLNQPIQLNYESSECVIFQRLSVSIFYIFYIIPVYNYLKAQNNDHFNYNILLLGFQVCLLFIDNIHFQYNAPLIGLLVLSVHSMEKKLYLKSAILFAILLCFKHIFLYVAPVYFFFLLFNYCFDDQGFQQKKFLQLAISVIIVFIISFTPFISYDQLWQIKQRLFPFQRGLVNAIWAPNFWAIYCFIDRLLTCVVRKSNIMKINITNSIVEGKMHLQEGIYVQKPIFNILPEISPQITIFLIILTSIPLWYKIVTQKQLSFTKICGLQSLIFFMFAYQAHEKAILVPLILFQMISLQNEKLAKDIYLMSIAANISFLPLFYWFQEQPIIFLLSLIYHLMYKLILKIQFDVYKMNTLSILELFGYIIFVSFFLLQIPFIRNKYEFLPTLVCSVFHYIYQRFTEQSLICMCYFKYICTEIILYRILLIQNKKQSLISKNHVISISRKIMYMPQFNTISQNILEKHPNQIPTYIIQQSKFNKIIKRKLSNQKEEKQNLL